MRRPRLTYANVMISRRAGWGEIFTVGGGEPQTTARLDVIAVGQLIWYTRPASEAADYTSLDQVAYWPE